MYADPAGIFLTENPIFQKKNAVLADFAAGLSLIIKQNPVFRRKYYAGSGVNKRVTMAKYEKASKYWKKSQYFLLALSFGLCYNDSTT